MKPLRVLMLPFVFAGAFSPHADAHAFLDHAMPAVGSVVHGAPSQIRLRFSERLEPAFSTMQVLDTNGKRIDKGDSQVDGNDAAILLVSVPQLAPGRYRVTWRVLSVDTHVTKGDFSFDVAP